MTQRFLVNPPMPDIVAQWHHSFTLLDCRAGDRVLDSGCDTGDADHLLLARMSAVRQIVSLDMRNRARDLWRARGAPAEIASVTGDGAALPFRDAAFERVFSADTLEWIASPLAALAEMRRVLRSDGLALLIDTDFEMQAFEGPDPLLSREIVQRFADLGPDGRIVRRLGFLVRQAGFRSVVTQIYTLVDERWAPDTYAHRIAGMVMDWIRERMPERMLRGGARVWSIQRQKGASGTLSIAISRSAGPEPARRSGKRKTSDL